MWGRVALYELCTREDNAVAALLSHTYEHGLKGHRTLVIGNRPY